MALDTVQGNGVEHASVDEDHAVALYGLVKRGEGDAGTDSLKEATLPDDDLAPGFQVGGYGTIGYRQVLYSHIGHKLHDSLDDALAFHQVIEREREVGEFEHLLPVDGLHPGSERLELACGIDASDEGSHGAACYRTDAIAVGLELLYGSDMGESSCTATRKD